MNGSNRKALWALTLPLTLVVGGMAMSGEVPVGGGDLVVTVPPPPALGPDLAGDGVSRAGAIRRRTYRAIEELGPAVLEMLDGRATRVEAARAWDAMRPQLDRLVPWLGGQGILVEVEVLRQRIPTEGPQQTRFEHMSLVGIGSSPDAVVGAPVRPPTLRPGSPTGSSQGRAPVGNDRRYWVTSNENSWFLWIKEGPDGLEVQEINGLAYGVLSANRRSVRAVGIARQALETQQEVERIAALERAVRHAPIEEAARRNAEAVLSNARESRQKLQEVRERLARDLRRAERAAAMLSFLDKLETGLSLAEKGRALFAQFGDAVPAAARSASDGETLYRAVVSEQLSLEDGNLKLRQEILRFSRDLDGSNIRLHSLQRDLDIPYPARIP
jgi:hypothetical protein